jgi:transcription antitermination factor NusG
MVAESDFKQWHAIRVRSRHERVVKNGLHSKGYEVFLPTYITKSQWSDRAKNVEQVLFPGYLFSLFELHERTPVVCVPGIVEIIGNGRTPVEETELAGIRALIDSGAMLTPCPFLHVGDKVLIQEGPFRGVEGIVLKFRQQRRLVVGLSLLQRAVSVELDGSCISSISRCERRAAV